MTNSTGCLGSLIDALGIHQGVAESLDRLELSGHVSAGQAEAVVSALRRIGYAEGWSVTVLDGEYAEITLDALADEDVNLIVRKPTGGRLFFATVDGFRAALGAPELSLAAEIHILGIPRAFATRRFRVEPWDGTLLPSISPVAPDPSTEPADPRRGLVRDLTGSEVSGDTFRWLPFGAEGEGDAWNTWRREATKRLALLPTSEVWMEGGGLKISIHGARKRIFDFSPDCLDVDTAFRPLAEAVEWLVMERGAEVRHEMLVRRLAAIVPEADGATSWCRLVPDSIREALEGAKLDFRAYARAKSAETLKAMADLRKAVSDDVNRIVERAQRLSNGFIAALAALATGLGVRLSLLSAKDNGGWASITFCFVVLAITWAGVCLQRQVNSKSLDDDFRNMRKWHRNVHIALSRKEYKELALRPVFDAIRLYRKTESNTRFGLYLATVIFIALFAFLPAVKGP